MSGKKMRFGRSSPLAVMLIPLSLTSDSPWTVLDSDQLGLLPGSTLTLLENPLTKALANMFI